MSADDQKPAVPPIPVGLEELVSLGAASEEFASALLDKPEEAVRASGVEMTPTERAMLRAIPASRLAQVMAEYREQLDAPERRRFLERASAAVVLLVGSGAPAGGCGKPSKTSTQKKASPEPMKSPTLAPDAAVTSPPPPAQIQAGLQPGRPPRPRPRRPSGIKTGISPSVRQKQKDRPGRMLLGTGSRPPRRSGKDKKP